MRPSILLVTSTLTVFLCIAGCQVTSKNTTAADLGIPITERDMLDALKKPGVITFEKHTSARWQVPLSGLLNLNHPKAIAAGLTDRDESIEIYVYSISHPTAGSYLVDSGVSENFRQSPTSPDIGSLVNTVMHFDEMQLIATTNDINATLPEISGVFLTHLHLDHILGLTDLDKDVPVYTGPRETTLKTPLNAFTQGTTNRLLKNQTVLHEWQFKESGILDVFGDGSLFAIHAPGHTLGTTAYIANTTTGVHMMLGDVTHTKWGWDNQVESGTYSHQPAESAHALATLAALAQAIGTATVHPGHQPLNAN